MSGEVEVLINHTHTPYSIASERDVHGNMNAINHNAAYAALIDHLPADVTPIIVRTEHYTADPAFFDEHHGFPARVKREYGGDYELHDTHVTGEIDGTSFAVINGVEASMNRDSSHVTVAGLDTDSEDVFFNLDTTELYDAVVEADGAWLATAHQHYRYPGVKDMSIPDNELHNLFTHAQGGEVPVAVGYTTGYDQINNMVARGTSRSLVGKPDVHDYAEEYDVPLVPEIDWHIAVHPGLEGTGVLREPVWDDLAEIDRVADMDVGKLLETDIVSYASDQRFKATEGLSATAFYRDTFPGSVPLPDRITTTVFTRTGTSPPATRDDFAAAVERYIGEINVSGDQLKRHADSI